MQAPVVGKKGVVCRSAKILIGIAERNRAGIGHAQQEAREIQARGCTGESKRSARVLLCEDVDLLPPEVAAEGDVMRAAIPQYGRAEAARLVPVEGWLRIRECRDAARERQDRRPPVHRLLIVPGNSGLAGDVAPASKVGCGSGRAAAELRSHSQKHARL